jgi:thiol-disulfide isomerase/thioredoxin/outer membrane lipoprotein-sorting protein
MRKVLTALVQATILFHSISASAQPTPDAQAILNKVNETYRNLKSYQFEYKTVSDSKTERDGLTSTMRDERLSRITVVRPDRIRVETQDSHSSVVFIADGNTVWLYSSQLNAYTKRAAGRVDIFAAAKSNYSRYEEMARQVNTKLADYARLTAEPHNLALLPNETLTVEGRQITCYVLSLVRGVGSNKDISRYWIDRERYLVLRESTDQTFPISSDSVMRSLRLVNFISAAINEPVADSAFSYRPPKGAIEIDRLDTESLARKRNAPVNRIGQAAPNFTLTDLNGAKVSLQSLRGKAVLLNFWASWCGPCVAEMPHLEKLHREYKNKDVIILGINDEEAEVAQNYLKRNRYTFNTLIDAEKQAWRSYRISAIPHSFFITKDGRIAASLLGQQRERDFRAGIEKALGESIEEPALKAAGVQAESELETVTLPAPKLVSPEDLSHFDHFPRTTVLVWKAVPGAIGYRVETDFQYSGKWASEDRGKSYAVEVTAPTYTFDFVGAQPGRWRVWAFDAKGREGARSEWREFVYSR